MKLNFEINGVAIRENEAKSLFTLSDETPSITIDLSEHLTKDCLDAKKLFNLSIKSKQPELAQLAAKLAMSTPQVKAKKKRNEVEKDKISTQKIEKISLDEALDKFMSSKSMTNVGAAMVLQGLSGKGWTTLKELATHHVNDLWVNDMNHRSMLFNGFKSNNGKFMPLVMKPGRGVQTYHSSGLYTALRDGARLLVKWGYAEVKEETSYGSEDKKLVGNENLLQRKVYKFALTEKGEVFVDTWADMYDYIFTYWDQKLN